MDLQFLRFCRPFLISRILRARTGHGSFECARHTRPTFAKMGVEKTLCRFVFGEALRLLRKKWRDQGDFLSLKINTPWRDHGRNYIHVARQLFAGIHHVTVEVFFTTRNERGVQRKTIQLEKNKSRFIGPCWTLVAQKTPNPSKIEMSIRCELEANHIKHEN